jgi:polyphosphate kinase
MRGYCRRWLEARGRDTIYNRLHPDCWPKASKIVSVMENSSSSESGAEARREAASAAIMVTAPSPETSNPPATPSLESPELYINRELSLLEFQKRVLEQAQSTENPLLERIKFLSILSSNLDEFFMVRVAGLQRQAASGLRRRMEALILREIALQEKGQPGHLIFKMNALEDPKMIRLLYRASQAGVKVDLLVRGLCCLRPGFNGVSDNIRVTSIVGRFLEHSRIYYFRNGGAEEIYLGSADLMRRNLSHRVEIIFPVRNPKLLHRLKDILGIQLADKKKSHQLQGDGRYLRSTGGEAASAVDSQLLLLTNERGSLKAAKGLAVMSRKRRTAVQRVRTRS